METELIAWIRRQLPSHPQLILPPGDDAAILQLRDPRCVVTTDLLADGVDFELARCDHKLVGRKALAVNLSDLAAMAARPVAAVVALNLPRTGGLELAKQFYAGLLPLAREFEVAIAGGDVNGWDGPFVVSITAIGEVTEHGAWLRSGAKPGDTILVTGALGGSILRHHFTFQPRIRQALWLNEHAEIHAATDISDGLLIDLSHILEESNVGAELDLARIPVSSDAEQLSRESEQKTPLEHALGDGEDFELILTCAAEVADELVASQPLGTPLARIGEIIGTPGLFEKRAGGRSPLQVTGFRHKFE